MLFRLFIFLVVAAWLPGCYDTYRVPEQERLIQIVWYGVYGNTREPPVIQWRRQNSLNCQSTGPTQNNVGFFVDKWYGGPVSDYCVVGAYWPSLCMAQIALPDGVPYHQGAFAHEMWHATLDARGLDSDPYHKDPGFMIGGIVDEANNILAAEGL
jgi:hypothetical protein